VFPSYLRGRIETSFFESFRLSTEVSFTLHTYSPNELIAICDHFVHPVFFLNLEILICQPTKNGTIKISAHALVPLIKKSNSTFFMQIECFKLAVRGSGLHVRTT
jgi:hypothetical protein